MILGYPGVEIGSQNRSKNGIEKGRHLGIDFWSILVDFGGQVGTKNRSKIGPESGPKNDAKRDGKKTEKKGAGEGNMGGGIQRRGGFSGPLRVEKR